MDYRLNKFTVSTIFYYLIGMMMCKKIVDGDGTQK